MVLALTLTDINGFVLLFVGSKSKLMDTLCFTFPWIEVEDNVYFEPWEARSDHGEARVVNLVPGALNGYFNR